MKRIKVIYINSRFYGRDFADESHPYFYLFGVGNLFAYELLKIFPQIEVENWRADKTVKQDLVRKIDGIVCRVFKGVETKFAGTYSVSMTKTLRSLIRQKDKCIIVHFQGMQNIGYDIIAWLIPQVPILATHHGGGNFKFKYSKNRKFKTFLADIIDKVSLKKRYDHLFIQTRTEERYLADFLPKENISCTPPFGFDFDIFKPLNKASAREKLGISIDKKVILSVSRAYPIKGVDKVISAYKELKKEISGLELFCVDVQPLDEQYNLVNESGAKVTGHVSYHELPLYYSAADILVYLPFDDESLNFAGPGYVNAEALACGIPVVSSLLVHYWDDSIHEVARIPRSQEEVVPMIRDLLEHPPDPARCREISFNYFNWDYVMKHHLEVYNRLLIKYYNTTIQGFKPTE